MNFQWRWAALKNGFQDAAAYPTEFLFEILGSALVPVVVQSIFWHALFHSGQRLQVGGLSYNDLMHYSLISLLFSQVRGGNHDFKLQEMIRTGQLSYYLLRPVGVVEFVYIRGIAPRLLIAGLGLLLGMVWVYVWDLSFFRLVGAMLLAWVGNVIHYQIGAILSTVAFFWEEAYSILIVKNILVSLLSGELIPLSLFPNSLSWIWKSTPFYLYIFAPTQYALGHWTHLQWIESLMVGVVWMGCCGWAIQMSWSFGMRRYLSLGG